ncbi:Arabinogalactan peptide 20, partial [Mucuna pruriens]
MNTMRFFALPLIALLFMAISHLGQAQDLAFSPAPPPSSDGTTVDQGIAYVLMLVALAITYMIH